MDYIVKLADLPYTVHGFVERENGYCTIVVNSRLSYEEQRKTCEHEIQHMENDLDKEITADEVEKTARLRPDGLRV